jgi:hypothetical protein
MRGLYTHHLNVRVELFAKYTGTVHFLCRNSLRNTLARFGYACMGYTSNYFEMYLLTYAWVGPSKLEPMLIMSRTVAPFSQAPFHKAGPKFFY